MRTNCGATCISQHYPSTDRQTGADTQTLISRHIGTVHQQTESGTHGYTYTPRHANLDTDTDRHGYIGPQARRHRGTQTQRHADTRRAHRQIHVLTYALTLQNKQTDSDKHRYSDTETLRHTVRTQGITLSLLARQVVASREALLISLLDPETYHLCMLHPCLPAYLPTCSMISVLWTSKFLPCSSAPRPKLVSLSQLS